MKNIKAMKKITTTKKIILSIFLFLMIGTIYAFSVPSRGTVITQEVGLAFGKSLGCIGQGLCISVPKERFAGATFDALGEVVIDKNGKTSLRL
jgi:hypothetical protein